MRSVTFSVYRLAKLIRDHCPLIFLTVCSGLVLYTNCVFRSRTVLCVQVSYCTLTVCSGLVRAEREDLADGSVHSVPGSRTRRTLDCQGNNAVLSLKASLYTCK